MVGDRFSVINVCCPFLSAKTAVGMYTYCFCIISDISLKKEKRSCQSTTPTQPGKMVHHSHPPANLRVSQRIILQPFRVISSSEGTPLSMPLWEPASLREHSLPWSIVSGISARY